jgi:hypothetical protein
MRAKGRPIWGWDDALTDIRLHLKLTGTSS